MTLIKHCLSAPIGIAVYCTSLQCHFSANTARQICSIVFKSKYVLTEIVGMPLRSKARVPRRNKGNKINSKTDEGEQNLTATVSSLR